MTVTDSVSRSGQVPVFPLPGVVFFPRTVLPLHVFESRYRALVRDATSGEGLVAVSMLCSGWEEDYEGSPAFRRIGTIGRIEDLRPLPDGRFLLRLVGLQRADLGEVVRERPYRLVRMRPLTETAVDDASPEIQSAKLDLLASHGCLIRELSSSGEEQVVLDDRMPLETVVNGACANLPVEASMRQELLEEDDLRRRLSRVSELLDELLERVLRLKSLRGKPDGGQLN